MTVQPELTAQPAPEDDAALVALIAGHDHRAFEAMMRKHNGKLFRVARAILRDDAEAEDALQDAYLDAYRHIADFRGGSSRLPATKAVRRRAWKETYRTRGWKHRQPPR